VPDLTSEDIRESGTNGRAVIKEMRSAGVFLSATAASTPRRSCAASYRTTRYWAGRIAVAVGWPQEVHRFSHAPS